MQIDELLSGLDKVRGGNGQFMACCPAHDDKSPSLAIKEVDGKILLNCMAGCDIHAITDAMGVKISDLFTDSNFTSKQRNQYRKLKNMSDLWKALNHELHVLLQIVSNRVCDEVLSQDRKFIEHRKDFKSLPSEFWQREIIAAKRVKAIVGDLYGV